MSEAPPPEAAAPDRKAGILARLFPPLTPAQAEALARIRFPCC
ncbi:MULTISPECIES: hypothetical protein [Roseicyclus]|jgi:hypothetical protein|uniref:Uncharacterized protein n=1 Tax=Roseicyclus marinus TaxID=2161673 RepID=A0AA48KJJ9_9RHOB|nr:hypothetical protein MACH21_03270 [Roseicyclus marinus]